MSVAKKQTADRTRESKAAWMDYQYYSSVQSRLVRTRKAFWHSFNELIKGNSLPQYLPSGHRDTFLWLKHSSFFVELER